MKFLALLNHPTSFSSELWWSNDYTANVFPIKSVGNPRVTRGTPQYTHNYHGVYLLPENPTVSIFRYACRYCMTIICIPYISIIQNLQGNPCKIYTDKSPQNLHREIPSKFTEGNPCKFYKNSGQIFFNGIKKNVIEKCNCNYQLQSNLISK